MKLVYGVGINDADYDVAINEYYTNDEGVKGERRIWTCPYYSRWMNMLTRCYSDKFQEGNPTYKGCYVAEEWKTFSNFKEWMVTQEWEGLELDKDILFVGNREYGPEKCVFVTKSD